MRPISVETFCVNLIHAKQFPDRSIDATLESLRERNPGLMFDKRHVPEAQSMWTLADQVHAKAQKQPAER